MNLNHWANGAWADGSWNPAAWENLNPPTLLGQIPNLSAAFDSGTHTVELGEYADNFTSASISPAVEAGWTFNTTTAQLVYDTDDEATFGAYTVTFTNANGDTDSNAFTVKVSVSSAPAYSDYIFGFALRF